MENVVEKVCHSCVVREVPGIVQCIKMPKKLETDATVFSKQKPLTGRSSLQKAKI